MKPFLRFYKLAVRLPRFFFSCRLHLIQHVWPLDHIHFSKTFGLFLKWSCPTYTLLSFCAYISLFNFSSYSKYILKNIFILSSNRDLRTGLRLATNSSEDVDRRDHLTTFSRCTMVWTARISKRIRLGGWMPVQSALFRLRAYRYINCLLPPLHAPAFSFYWLLFHHNTTKTAFSLETTLKKLLVCILS